MKYSKDIIVIKGLTSSRIPLSRRVDSKHSLADVDVRTIPKRVKTIVF